MSSSPAISAKLSSVRLPGKFDRWLDAPPHPHLICEIDPSRVVVARFPRGRHRIEECSIEPVPAGSVVASPVEPNLVNPAAVRRALNRAFAAVDARGQEIALLIPDQVVRVFLLQFDSFPRRADEAIPLLRWRLKKSVPFDVDETVVSYMLQPARTTGVEVLTALARQRIVRQYEEIIEASGMTPAVVLGSTLATMPLLRDTRPTLVARLSATTLTTLVVRGDIVCVYRCTEMARDAALLEPRALVEEIYPAVAYYQDTWQGGIEQVRLSGLGERFPDFKNAVQAELNCAVAPLVEPTLLSDHLASEVRRTAERHLDAALGWMLNDKA